MVGKFNFNAMQLIQSSSFPANSVRKMHNCKLSDERELDLLTQNCIENSHTVESIPKFVFVVV